MPLPPNDEYQAISVINQLPWVLFIFSWVIRATTTASVVSLIAARIGGSFGARDIAWIVGAAAGAVASPFVRLAGSWGLPGRVHEGDTVVFERPTNDIKYPGAKEIAGATQDGRPVRIFVLPRPKLQVWLSKLKSPLWLTATPFALGWVSIVWMFVAVSPWGNAGWFTRKIAADMMWATLMSLPVTIVLILIACAFSRFGRSEPPEQESTDTKQ